jgi:hypothetical protein
MQAVDRPSGTGAPASQAVRIGTKDSTAPRVISGLPRRCASRQIWTNPPKAAGDSILAADDRVVRTRDRRNPIG